MALPLDASEAVKDALRQLKSDELTRPAYDAIAARIALLRNDPGAPQFRGNVFRVLDGQTVRVPLIYVPETQEEWAMAWAITEPDGVATFTVVGLEKT